MVILVLGKHFYKDSNVHRQHRSPCEFCELLPQRTPRADMFSRLYLLFYLQVVKPYGPQQPAIPFLYYRVLPGRRFSLLCNDKMKLKGVAENLKKFELKPKNSPNPKIN